MARSTPVAGAAAWDFLVDYLRTHPKAAYAEVWAAAKEAGHRVFPLTFERARAQLPLPAKKPRASPRTPKPAAKAAAPRRAIPKAPARKPLRQVLPIGSTKEARAWQKLIGRINDGAPAALEFDGRVWRLVVL